jgi:hypothetical protein
MCGAVVALWGLAAMPATAQANPILLSIGEGTGNVGDTALVSIELSVGNTRPTNMVVWLRYNPAKVQPDTNAFEFTVVDLEGNPLRDNQNNVITSRGPVRREQSLITANKQIDSEVHAEGALGIAVQGLNDATIAPGNILTVAFKVLPGVAENEVIAIEGAEELDPVQFTDGGVLETASSSANYTNGSGAEAELGVEISDGRVVVPCTQPDAPTNVQATQGQPDAVVVSWTGIAQAGARYRVYRSATNDAASALPLSTGPQSATTFNDITALGPVTPTGCACNAEPQLTRYFYFVRTVSAGGCESEFSTPGAEGYRGAAKAASAAAGTVLDTLPAKASSVASNVAVAGQSVAVRLEGVAAGSAWASATSGTWTSANFRWVADGADSGWATVDLPASLAVGTHVLLSAGGNGAGPAVREFVVAEGGKSANTVSVTDLGEDAVQWLPEGVGSVYGIGPASVFAASTAVYLPVPAGEDVEALKVFVYVGDQGDRRWYLGENVTGWLAAAPEVVQVNGAPHVKLVVRHGAIVQLGHAPGAQVRPASIAPLDLAKMRAGDLAVLALFGAVVLAARLRQRRTN